MDPVVYDFALNEEGSVAARLEGAAALLPPAFYQQAVPGWLRRQARDLSPRERADLQQFTRAARQGGEFAALLPSLLDRLLPGTSGAEGEAGLLDRLLDGNGFDRDQHEQIRTDLRAGRIGLARNRLPPSTRIEDVAPGDLFTAENASAELRAEGAAALRRGEAAVVTYAAGVGSRWTQGAGVAKALHPFAKFSGRHRSFAEVHLAKSRHTAAEHGTTIPHVFTTSHLTHAALAGHLASLGPMPGTEALLSPGRSIGLRLVPMERDLHFAWQETAQQRLDEQKEKVRGSVRAALVQWARAAGEGADYTDNLPAQCLHPVGHWFELPNLLKNGTLARLLTDRPALRTLLVHNIDTLGATLDPALLGWFRRSGATLGWEVIPRRLEDHGGGLARVDGRLRLVEGLALPREEDEFALTFYSTNTCWVDIDRLLDLFGLTRAEAADPVRTAAAVRVLAARLPTYVTLKEVKRRWGHGQEDVFPVAQFEKLWGDMTAVAECPSVFAAVPRARGQQLKDQAQLDGWARDGSARHVDRLCAW
jgi:hypothetical protein